MGPFKVMELSKNRTESCKGDREEPEEDPEEEPEEDPEEDLDEDPEEDPDEDPEEDSEFELEIDQEKVLGEESNGIVIEASEEDPDEDPSEEDPDELCSEKDPDELCSEKDPVKNPSEEDPSDDPSEEVSDKNSVEECVSQPSSWINTNQTDHDASEFAYQSNTKCKYEDALKPGVAHASAAEAMHGFSGVSKSVGDTDGASENDHLENSGKRRCSRWDQQPQQFPDASQTGNGKRRKTRWGINDSQMKLPDPLQPTKSTVGPELDSVVHGLKLRLRELNSKLSSSEVQDDRPPDKRSPSPEPVFNNLGIRVNTREARFREKLNREQQQIIAKLMKKIPGSETPAMNKRAKLFKKVYIPVKEYPTYNFIGLILGPRGNTQKRMEKETGAQILLRGKGFSAKTVLNTCPSDDEDLHVYIEADEQRSLDAAVAMVEKLLIPQDDQRNAHKLSQLQELAKLNGNYRDGNFCNVCKEEGHKSYACPNRPSTLKTIIPCDTCGTSSHLTSSCPLTASSQISKQKKEIDASNLYVGYLPETVCDSRLREMFSPFGKIISSIVMKHLDTGLSKGYGFVKFENVTDATSAVMHLHGYQIEGHTLAVRVAGTPPPGTPQSGTGFSALNPIPVSPAPAPVYPGSNPNLKSNQKKEIDASNLYVGHLPNTVYDSRLREMFSPFGKIISSTVMKHLDTGLSKGYGFVKFENVTDAASAVMHLHGYQIEGHMLAVRVAGTPPPGTPQSGTGFSALNPIPLSPAPAPVYPGSNPNLKSNQKKEIDASNLYVGHLPNTVCDSRLRDMFSPFGKIISSTVMKHLDTGLSKGYGFVKFENVTDAASAVMHLHGYQIEGHMLAVRVAGTPPLGTSQAGTGFSPLNPIPVCPAPAPAPVYPGALNQAAWPVQPMSMLPAAQVHFPSSLGLGLPHQVTSSGPGYQHMSIGSTNFNNFAVTQTFIEPKGALQSYARPNIGSTTFGSPVISTSSESKGSSQSPYPIAQFPGDPDYPGSRLPSYFTPH